MVYDFHNKEFKLLDNSASGEVDDSTQFAFTQKGNLVTADYSGGRVRYGRIIAKLVNDHLEMLYHCMTKDGDLKAGKAIAKITKNEEDRLVLKLNWQWLTHDLDKGESLYIEI